MSSYSFADLTWDNSFTRELPADKNPANGVRQVLEAAYSRVTPVQTSAPKLVASSAEMRSLLDLHPSVVEGEEFLQVMSGNSAVEGSDAYAMCYGGHQFGNWAGQLGDGRAINLGEVLTSQHGRQTLQLKGAGPTPYSRRADGLAVLRSSLREFLCSEAMHFLGVPTTRALSLVLSGEAVVRDMFYDGNPVLEQGAVVCRVAPSFIRFGNFEIFAARGDTANLRRLLDYTITHFFAHLLDSTSAPLPKSAYVNWLAEVAKLTADLVVDWQRVGFVHGVMNTDNMSIHGLTIDYGPYGWLENYDPNWTPNTTDAATKRYRFGAQPQIAAWNLERLANALYPLVRDVDALSGALNSYVSRFNERWVLMMADKLGCTDFDSHTDRPLIDDLLDLLPHAETDMTLFFRGLANVDCESARLTDDDLLAPLMEAFYVPEQVTGDFREALVAWLCSYRQRVGVDGRADVERRAAMNKVNPKFVLRNYLAQLAIDDAEQGNFELTEKLLDVLRKPYDEQPQYDHLAARRPDWARSRPGCSMLSCSS